MSSVYPLQSSFNNGEISPLLSSAVDFDFWSRSLTYCRNFQILPHGGIRRRSGSRFVAEVRNSAAVARILPFKFSETQSYVLSLNDAFIRFFALRGVVGAPYEISHPWASADLARLSYAQFNDVAYTAHKSYAPQKLSRLGDTNWTLGNAPFKDGPYLPANPTATTLTPADYGALTPVMTGLSSPSGTVTSTASVADAYEVFDKNPSTDVFWSGVSSGFVAYQLAGGAQAIVDHYYVTATDDSSAVVRTPTSWVIEGSNDGSSWVTLDTRTGETGWTAGETRFYEFANANAYEYHRLRWKGVDGSVGNSQIAEIGFNKAAASQTPFNLTASSTAGINDGAGFQASDVGRPIRLKGSDGKWRWAEISSRVSSTVVTIRLYGHALPDLSPIVNWRLGSWSASSGFPGSVALYSERVTWARSNKQPVTVWGSKQGSFDDMGVSDPSVGTDGIDITLLSSNMNEVLWLTDDEDIVTGSAGQIRSIGPADVTQSFSAINISQKKGPTSGAAYLQPLSIGGVTLYVGAGGTKIRELVLGDQNRYVAPELSVLAEHMFKTGIVDWAYSEKPDPTIYAALGDGLLCAITYDREQKVLGFTRHDLGGAVENVAIIPGVTAGTDDVYLVVRRTINGQTKRYIEVLEKPFDGEVDAVEDAFFVDCGVTYSGAPITTVTGLGHLEGETVKVLADGQAMAGPFEVSGGSITLPNAASKISIGLPFKSRAITMPVAGPGQDGTLFGRRVNNMAVFVDLMATGSMKVGAYADGDWTPPLSEQVMKQGGGLFTDPASLVSGYQRCDIEGSWAEGQGRIVMECDDPLPCLVRAVALQSEVEP